MGGGESAAVCVSPAARLKENLFFVFVLACLRFSDRAKGIKKVMGMCVVRSFSASRVSCPQDSFTEASFTNYPAYLPYLRLMVKKNPGPIHQMKTMGPCFTFAFYSN